MTDLGVREITQQQGSPEWFALRRFVITSNVAVKFLRLMLQQLSTTMDGDEIRFLTDNLGMMSIPEGEGLSDDVLSQQTKSVEELKNEC